MLVQMFWLFFRHHKFCLVFLSILASFFFGGTLSLEFMKPNFSNDIFHRNSNFPTSKFLKYNFWTVSGQTKKNLSFHSICKIQMQLSQLAIKYCNNCRNNSQIPYNNTNSWQHIFIEVIVSFREVIVSFRSRFCTFRQRSRN